MATYHYLEQGQQTL